MKMSTSVPTKGASGRFMVDKAIEFIEECGNGKNDSIIVKTDQEEAIKYFTKDLREVREGKTILEESPVHDMEFEGGQIAWDDVHGEELDLRLVSKARKEEIDYMECRGIWEVCDEAEAWREMGQGPTSTKWVDTNKGTKLDPLVRCRLVPETSGRKGIKTEKTCSRRPRRWGRSGSC